MRSRHALLTTVGLAVLAVAGKAEAQRTPPTYKIPAAGDVEATAKLGYALGRVAHHKFQGLNAPGVLIEGDLGYRLTPAWSIGLQVSGTETPVEKIDDNLYGRPGTTFQSSKVASITQYATCPGCDGPGGLIFAESLRTAVIGPRIEFSPRSLDGGYLALAGGVGSLTIEDTEVASALSVRAGYRYQFASSVSAGLGVGLTGIFIQENRAWLPYAAAELRLF